MMDDAEEAKPRAPRIDLDRLSVAELEARIETLEAEIGVCREMIATKRGHLSAADKLFQR